ncbi:hypothetical protein [Actinomadura rubrisoli]|uniref:Matrixin family metalloprotease n=1 Tax=Actinomadura rubrisoli TaxID=2530368 RepID=A0A4R5BPB0_9ACTN|nr:hypothetical protein [Actinomadura rubrisoli]TDD88728.1 hypothetical protein E1298_14965 [Actinomadura rubrisoli]
METTASAGQSPDRPINRYGPLDSPPVEAEEARGRLAPGQVAILDVQPVERVMSDQPFQLRVRLAGGTGEGVVSVLTHWAGTPFVVERRIGADDHDRGYADVEFTADQSLPPGPATFTVGVIVESGAQADFTVSVAVLPSNPFSMRLSPRDNFVTGTFSVRAVKSGNSYQINMTVTLSNGDAAAVAMRQDFRWEFWDGPVGGGTLVEQGTGGFPDPITVGAHSTWEGWIAFNSPSGSGIFNKLEGREDLAVRIIMTRQSGGTVEAQITVRTMFSYGLNITRVGAESFTNEEYTDLYRAVDVTRTIYERRDVTVAVDRRFISNASAGGFTVITSETEARDLFEQWSGPDNGFIDVFVVPSISGTGFDGLAGAIPGPTSHDGRNSGVVVDKSGFVDGAGVRHLNVAYLGMLIGHEVGHYLGLVHVSEAGNLMLSSSTATDTNLNYDPQYRTIIRHGWVRIA